jgi:hypothetical protein
LRNDIATSCASVKTDDVIQPGEIACDAVCTLSPSRILNVTVITHHPPVRGTTS